MNSKEESTFETLLEQLKDEDLTEEELKLIEQVDEIVAHNKFDMLIQVK